MTELSDAELPADKLSAKDMTSSVAAIPEVLAPLVDQPTLDEVAVKVALATSGVLGAVASGNRRLRPGANAPTTGVSVALELTVRYGSPVGSMSGSLRAAIAKALQESHGVTLADCDIDIAKFVVDGQPVNGRRVGAKQIDDKRLDSQHVDVKKIDVQKSPSA